MTDIEGHLNSPLKPLLCDNADLIQSQTFS
jgi:hypothetical protein